MLLSGTGTEGSHTREHTHTMQKRKEGAWAVGKLTSGRRVWTAQKRLDSRDDWGPGVVSTIKLANMRTLLPSRKLR